MFAIQELKVIKGYNEKLDKNASKGFDENLLYYQIKMMSPKTLIQIKH